MNNVSYLLWMVVCRSPQLQKKFIATFLLLSLMSQPSPNRQYHHSGHHSFLHDSPEMLIYCPGHAGYSGNKRADRLASTSGLHVGRAEVLGGLTNFLDMDRPEHHSTVCLKEKGAEKGSGRHFEVGNDLRSTRQACTLFREQSWGDC